MPTVAGIDSCPGGWLAVLVTFYEEVVDERHYRFERFEEIFSIESPPSFIGVDVPIGRLEEPREGGRECDKAARKVLGRPRSSSVFSPPVRPALECETFDQGREFSLNRQSFSIIPKVRELDQIMTPDLQKRIREVHPEVSFFTMAGLSPAAEGKKKIAGRKERIQLLSGVFYQVEEGLSRFRSREAAPDDILDAYACAWSAMRIFRGEAGWLPDHPPRDERGLEMGIWY